MTEKEKKVNFKYNFKIYLKFLGKYKALALSLILVVMMIEVLRIVDKLLFKSVIDNGTLYLAGTISKSGYFEILSIVLIAFISASSFRVIGRWLSLHFLIKLDSRLITDIKQHFFNHLIHLSHNFHTTHKTGSLIARINRGAGATERMTDFMMFNILPLIIQFLVVGSSLLYFDPFTALVVLGIATSFIGYSLWIQHLQRPTSIFMNDTEDIEKANIGDVFTNIESVKYFGKENNIKNRFASLSNETKKAILRYEGYYRWLDSGHTFIVAIGTFLLLYFPIMRFFQGEISLGTLVFIYTIYGNLLEPIYGFVHGMRGFYRSMADFEDLFQYGKIQNEIKDKPHASDLKVKNGSIEFRDVSFKYNDRAILSNFNLKIKENEKIALVGHSGAGKTTIVKLLYRLYDLNKGSILIDGKDIKDFKQESLRSELSIVPQECILFDDTIYNNILFSRPDASKEEVLEAIKFSQLDKIISKFPNKEKTIVGQRGIKLSGGEKQRVSIARAILANKKILVLDEATSSLDSQTENEIQRDLEKLLENRTSIIIAHRLSTVMKADKIVVLEEGKISQIGSHRELLRKKGIYQKLWNLQRGGYLQE